MNKLYRLSFLLAYACFQQAYAEVFLIDAARSSASFEVGYFPSGKVTGLLQRVTGKVEMDVKTKQGAGEVVFDMSMVETGNGITNSFIRSSKVFDIKKYPTMQFRPTRFDFEGEYLSAVNGDLVLHGVTRSIRLEVKQFSCFDNGVDNGQYSACKGEFTTVVYRSHFGMGRYQFFVDDDVLIDVTLAFDRRMP